MSFPSNQVSRLFTFFPSSLTVSFIVSFKLSWDDEQVSYCSAISLNSISAAAEICFTEEGDITRRFGPMRLFYLRHGSLKTQMIFERFYAHYY